MRSHHAVPLLLAAAALLAPAAASAAPKGCDDTDKAACLLPFPNNEFTVKDKTTKTGLRLSFTAAQMPKNKAGKPFSPTDLNRFDGFSPGSVILTKVPGIDTPADLEKTGAVPVDDLARYADKKAPVVVTDTATGKRWPIWAEVDSNVKNVKNALLEIHPAKNFLEGHTYRVALAFKHTKRSWRFTVASERSLSERMLSIRDDAFRQLGDTNLGDGKVAGNAPAFTITSVEDLPDNPKIAKRVIGTFTVPCYLDKPGCPPGSKFHLDKKTGLPTQIPGNVQTASFRCIVPRSATPATPARISLYGHGLLGSNNEVEAGNVQDMASEHDYVFCATNWSGMSSEDVPNAIKVLADFSGFPTMADRLQQGVLNTLYLGRLMLNPAGLASQPAFAGLLNTAELYSDGNSQGGIMGGMLTAVAPDFTRAVLGVPAMNYSVLLPRSKDWDAYRLIFDPAHPKELERPLVLDLAQIMWDRGEADGYAQHMTTDPYPGTPKHVVLMHPALGDQQVSTFQAEVEARTIGASVRTPIADPGRYPEKTPFWGIPKIGSFPFSGSAIVLWDSGPGHSGSPPLTNTAPRTLTDPHEDPRATAAARTQKAAFLAPGGKVVDVCGAGPCHTDRFTP